MVNSLDGSSDIGPVDGRRTGHLGDLGAQDDYGAALDTVGMEPLPSDSQLWDLPNTIITSHVAAFTDGLGNEMANFWVENMRRFAENEPLLGTVHRNEGY